jgi:putative ABC transport system substrate-binding protein
MNTKIAVLVFAFLFFLTAQVADAQQPGKVPRIGYLSESSLGSAGPQSPQLTGFLLGMRELGYVDGKNIAIEYRFTEGKRDRLPEVAAELARLKVDIIVTETGFAALQAKKATQTIPIVMGVSGDPVTLGLVASLAHPGGNVTGLTVISTATTGRRLQLLAEAVPKLTHVGVLWSGISSPMPDREWADTRAAAQPLKVQLFSLAARGPEELPGAFAEAARQHVQAVFMFDFPPLASDAAAARTAELALKNRLPMISIYPWLTQQGGLMSYSGDIFFPELSRRAATYVDRILKGAKPGDLPVEQPTKFELVINLKTAKALGLTIPQSVLNQADRVLE